jgi:hypothetical protein
LADEHSSLISVNPKIDTHVWIIQKEKREGNASRKICEDDGRCPQTLA